MVNAGAQEGHHQRTAGASGEGGDVGRCVSGDGMQYQRGANESGQVRGEDMWERRQRARADRVDGSGGGGVVVAEGEDTSKPPQPGRGTTGGARSGRDLQFRYGHHFSEW